jgi:hypothetical protein
MQYRTHYGRLRSPPTQLMSGICLATASTSRTLELRSLFVSAQPNYRRTAYLKRSLSTSLSPMAPADTKNGTKYFEPKCYQDLGYQRSRR